MIEVNVIIPLNEDYGIYGGYIKVVGTSFKNNPTSLPRHITIRGFFEKVTSKSTYSGRIMNLCRDINIRIIKEIEGVQRDVSQYIKVKRELKNSYDPNAIAVYVNTVSQFTKIGYLPKNLSELIVTNEFKCYVVGFEKSGKGILLTMVFSSPDVSFIALSSKVVKPKKSEGIGFTSLNKIRKKLCTR